MSISAYSNEISPIKQALQTVRNLREKLEAHISEPIAIVGLGCRVPGAETTDQFWKLLIEKRDVISVIPQERWNTAELYNPDPQAIGKASTQWAGTIPADQFDAEFFGISAEEACHMDPHQRVFLEVAWDAIEDAGLTREDLAGSQTGVFVGVLNYNGDYGRNVFSDLERIGVFSGPGVSNSVLAGRLAYIFDLKGPNLSIDTACSSSLVALHLACQSLRQKECNAAIVGGVNLTLAPEFTIATSRMQLMAADGRCKPFDAAADGIVRSDGCGVVILKRLSDALREGDRVLAAVRSSAVNQDGRTNGLTAPNGHAQSTLIRQALLHARLRQSDIGYVEAHGTGTALGDPIEIAALAEAIGERPDNDPCYVGSVKGNLGHCEAAAGIVSLIKVVLSIQHDCIPPQANLSKVNPHIDLYRNRLAFPRESIPWPCEDGKPKRAGVSSFGWSGTNAHVIVEHPPLSAVENVQPLNSFILPLSGMSDDMLRIRVRSMVERLGDGTNSSALTDICFTAAARRTHYDHRQAFVGRSSESLIASIKNWLQSESCLRKNAPSKLAIVFSGQGDQWPGMVDELMESELIFREEMSKCDKVIQRLAGWSIIDSIRKGGTADLSKTSIAQPCIVSMQISLFAMLQSWGLSPTAVTGHSVGEFSAAYCAGIITLEDMLAAVIDRGRIMEVIRSDGSMFAVLASYKKVLDIISNKVGVSISALNGPQLTVLSVDTTVRNEVLEILRQANLEIFPVNPHYAFHCHQIDKLSSELWDAFKPLKPLASKFMIASTAQGTVIEAQRMDPQYWVDNARQPVRFAEAIDSLVAQGIDDFLEVGPHSALIQHISKCLERVGKHGRAVGLLQRGRPQYESVLRAVATFYSLGHNFNWKALLKDRGSVTSLPQYVWQHKTYWIPLPTLTKPTTKVNKLGGDLDIPGLENLTFQAKWGAKEHPLLADHCMFDRVVVPGAVHLATVASHAAHYLKSYRFAITNVTFIQPLVMAPSQGCPIKLEFSSHKEKTNELGFTVGATGKDSNDLLLSIGTVEEESLSDFAPTEQKTLTDSVQSLQRLDVESFYERAYEAGLQLGPSFRWIKEIWTDPKCNNIVFTLDRPIDCRLDSEMVLHPGLLDSCFQAIFAAFWARYPDADLFIPLSVDRFQIKQKLQSPIKGVASITSRIDLEVETISGDFSLFAASGKCIAQLSQVTLKRAKRGALLRTGESSKAQLYRYDWTDLELPLSVNQIPEKCTLLSRDRQFADFLKLSLIEKGVNTTIVEINSDISFATDLPALHGLVLYLAESSIEESDFTASEILSRERRAFNDVLQIANAISQSSIHSNMSLWVVTRNTHSVRGDTGIIDISGASLWGLGRTIAKEYSTIWGGLVDLPMQEAFGDHLIEQFLSLIKAKNKGFEFIVREGQVSERRVTLISQERTKIPLRQEGTYLITGGFGETGRALASHLFCAGAKYVMLFGHAAPSPALIADTKAFKEKGLDLHLYQGDVALIEDVAAALRTIDRFMKPLAGVFHIAGVLDDAALANIEDNAVNRIFLPKICGIWNLHCATKKKSLDLFVAFSSLSGVIGMPGQGAYAAANSFVDALVRYRASKGLPATAVAWGPWMGGMTARLNQTGRKRLSELGIRLLDFNDVKGFVTSQQVLSVTNIIIANMSQEALEKLVCRYSVPEATAVGNLNQSFEVNKLTEILTVSQGTGRKTALLRFIIAELGKVVPTKHVDGDSPLRSLGLDSLSAVAIVQSIRLQTGRSIPITLLFENYSLSEVAAKLDVHLANK